MRRPFAIPALLALMILGILLPQSAALADGSEPTVSELADRWVAENGGAGASDTSSYWPDTWLLDKAFGRDQSSTMQLILDQISRAYDAQERGTDGKDRCPNAVKEKLDLYAADSASMFARPDFGKFLFKAGINIFSLPKTATGSVLDAAQTRVRDQFMGYLRDKAKELPENAFKKIEELLAEPGAPEVFSRNGSITSSAANDCEISIRVVWNKALQTSGSGEDRQFYQSYSFLINARCQCECDDRTGVERHNPDKVKSVVSGGTGRIAVNVRATEISFRPARPVLWAEFNCCGPTRTQRIGRPPSRAGDGAGTRPAAPEEPPPPPSEADRAAEKAERSPATQQAVEDFGKEIAGAKNVSELEAVSVRIEGAREGYKRQAALSPPGSPSGKAAREVAEALDELMRDALQKKYEELERQQGGTGFADPEPGDWLAALNTQPVYCPVDRTWSESLLEEYAVAVQVPEQCVGTWYYLERGIIEQPGHVAIPTPPENLAPPSGSGPPAEPEFPLCPGTPEQPVPQTPSTVETPAPGEKPLETVTPPEETGVPDDTPPSTITGLEVPEEPSDPDLGLVKATAEVVELALSTRETGNPISGATVKLLAPAPDLPGGTPEESQLTAAEHYLSDVPATSVDEVGTVRLSLTPVAEEGRPPELALAESELDLVDVEPGQGEVTAVQREEKRLINIDDVPPKQIIVAGNRPMTSLPASLLPVGSRACISRGFRVADTPVFVVKVPENELKPFEDRLRTSDVVSFFEPDRCREKETDDPYFRGKGLWGQDFDDQWAIKRVNIDEGSSAAQDPADAKTITVAVIDTGLDWYHPDLPQTSVWRNPAEVPGNGVDDDRNGYVDDVIGWNFVRPGQPPWDYDGHGTFVTGVIAAGRNNAVGISGINPKARIMVLKALDEFGHGNASMIAEAITYAADNGATIINLSLGGRDLTALEGIAVEHARARGAVVVAASGNDGEDVSGYGPAGIDGVITVAATDRRDRRAGFANWGPSVDIAAPGVDVLSLRARGTDLLSFIPGVEYEKGQGIVGKDRAYYRASGTSFAAPIVSGALSLLMSRRPGLSSGQAVRMLLQSARDIETPGVDNYTGYGLLDVEAALQADPDYFVESRIHGVEVVGEGAPALRVIATVDANDLEGAVLMLGAGDAPEKWLKVNRDFKTAVRHQPMVDLPAKFFSGSKIWTIRLITRHRNGSEREARFKVTLG